MPIRRPLREPHLNPKHDDVLMRFGRRLRELRLKRGLSQQQMSADFGIDRSYISDLERGVLTCKLPMIETLAKGLRITMSELLKGL